MIFSERLYKLLNKDEFEWVALHESAHYLMRHNLRFALIQITILFFGVNSVMSFPMVARYIIPYFVLLALIYIQLVKWFEYQADLYAVKKMDNPKGLITANIKMKKINRFLNSSNFIYKLLVIQIPYNERIKLAENELKLRKNK
ncbi:MAG: M48 family metalloprotease, partial [bacterium]|nr:M48 family metalloprotease [bacterium]